MARTQLDTDSLSLTGNLGVGALGSWNTSLKAVQVQTTSMAANNGAWSLFGYNLVYAAGGYQYVVNDYACMYQQGSGQHRWYVAPSGTAGASATFTQTMTLDGNGNLLVGVTSGTYHSINKSNTGENAAVCEIKGIGTAGGYSLFVASVGDSTYNTAATSLKVGKNTTTGRSINAAGTINASGADYAEYMPKASDCGVISKGQIVGVNAEGKLTDKWADSVSFLIKSTDPSYVGGDTWGTEEALGINKPEEPVFQSPRQEDGEEDDAYTARLEALSDDFNSTTYAEYQKQLKSFTEALEAARANVDRIAFCGQVPVNVVVAKPGQYIVPVQDGEGIAGIAVDDADITFQQYRKAVGIVQNILPDGRANVRVKVV